MRAAGALRTGELGCFGKGLENQRSLSATQAVKPQKGHVPPVSSPGRFIPELQFVKSDSGSQRISELRGPQAPPLFHIQGWEGKQRIEGPPMTESNLDRGILISA